MGDTLYNGKKVVAVHGVIESHLGEGESEGTYYGDYLTHVEVEFEDERSEDVTVNIIEGPYANITEGKVAAILGVPKDLVFLEDKTYGTRGRVPDDDSEYE